MPCLDVLNISVGIDVGSSTPRPARHVGIDVGSSTPRPARCVDIDVGSSTPRPAIGVLAAQTTAVQHQLGFHQTRLAKSFLDCDL